MSRMSAAGVVVRRVLVKRPWIHWLLVTLAALGAAGSMLERADRIDAARDAWGRTRDVWVAAVDHEPGDPLDVERRSVPAAFVEGDVADAAGVPDGAIARRHLGAGEIVRRADLAAKGGPQALTPAGWLVVPVVESPPSGAAVGDRARAVSEGVAVGEDALVVGHHDDATLLAVPAASAPLVAAASDAGHVTLLLIP